MSRASLGTGRSTGGGPPGRSALQVSRVEDTALEAACSPDTAYCGIVVTLYHTTDSADAILQAGFRDGEGSYGIVNFDLRGVFVSVLPADISDGATGDQVLEVVLPDDLDLDEWSIVEEGHPAWEWCIPAQVLNTRATVRLLTQDEVDAVKMSSWGGPAKL
jgi:hypothetical protein